MTAIKQLQLSYSAEEDRVLLRVNTSNNEEFRFWLTRRFCGILSQALQSHRASDPDVATQPTEVARQVVQSFKRDAANSTGNFKDDFTESETFPLGDAPMLAFKLSYRIENESLHLSIVPKSGSGINLVLNSDLNFNVSKLLRGAVAKADWGLDLGQATD